MKFHNRRVVTGLFVSQEKKVKRKSRKEVGGRSLSTRLAHRAVECAFAVSLMLGGAITETASAAAMPAGSRAWMVFTGNACGPSDMSLCATSNTLGPNPPNGIPTSTFSEGPLNAFQTGSAEILPDRMRSFNSGYGGSHMYTSMFDTYTVHGVAGDPFGITVHLAVDGVARAILVAGTYMSGGAVALEIGTWDPTTNDLNERSRVTQFNDSTQAMYIVPSSSSSAPFEQGVDVATSYSRTVSVGDVFDIGYNVSTDTAWGEIDLLNTAVISFDLPQGVYLTSSMGGTFGAPVPVPAAVWLFGSGLLGLIGVARRKARTA